MITVNRRNGVWIPDSPWPHYGPITVMTPWGEQDLPEDQYAALPRRKFSQPVVAQLRASGIIAPHEPDQPEYGGPHGMDLDSLMRGKMPVSERWMPADTHKKYILDNHELQTNDAGCGVLWSYLNSARRARGREPGFVAVWQDRHCGDGVSGDTVEEVLRRIAAIVDYDGSDRDRRYYRPAQQLVTPDCPVCKTGHPSLVAPTTFERWFKWRGGRSRSGGLRRSGGPFCTGIFRPRKRRRTRKRNTEPNQSL